MRHVRYVVWGGAFVATSAVLAVAVMNGELGDTTILTTVLGFGIAATGLALNLARTSADGERPSPAEVLDARAEQLAAAVEQQWQSEWRLRRLQDPEPIAVHWSSAEPWLADPREPGTDGRAPDDRLENIAAALDRVASRRLVVLGEPGSGKTVLAVRFTLDVLASRDPGAPVPVVVSMSDWRPQSESLDTWLARYLAGHYPGASWARELLDAGRVIPVLDGLDEMAPPLRTSAVRRLNTDLDVGRPLLMTCRSAVYADVVRSSDVLTSAAVVELQPLDFETAAAYLLRTARPTRGPGGTRTTAWHPVIDRLRTDPGAHPCTALRAVLRTPLMVTLARTAYDDTDADPAELLDDGGRDDRAQRQARLEAHLLDAFVPAAYRDDNRRVDTALHTLGFLARHLERQGSRELAWWELRRELPLPLRTMGPVLVVGALAAAVIVLTTGSERGWAVLITAGFLVPLCVGQALFLRSDSGLAGGLGPDGSTRTGRARVPRELVWVLMGAVPLGLVVGMAGSLSLNSYATPVQRWPWLGNGALAMTGGLGLATAIGVLGLLGRPVPSTVPLTTGRGGHSWRRRALASLVVLAAAAIGVLVPAALMLPFRISVLCATALGIAVTVALWPNPGAAGRTLSPPRATAGRRARPRGQVLSVVGRGMVKGLAAGLLLGLAFGVSNGSAVAVRAAVDRDDYPAGGSWHTSADGGRVLVAHGWSHRRLADGTRVVSTPGPVRWAVDRQSDGAVYSMTMTSFAAGCTGVCETFNSPVELHEHPDRGDLLAKLPDGTFAEDWDLQDELPPASRGWLQLSAPEALFGRATGEGLAFGLSLGLVSGLTVALHRWLVSPTDIARAGTPLDGLRADGATAVSRGVLLFLIASANAALVFRSWFDTTFADGSLVIWLITAPLAIALSAWGWLLVTRLWLCGTGRLPWRLMRFLEDAHRRGVLRQAGALYEFRHARLQERLATRLDV
ncbi:NACHT domain-containing protein [Streptomyces sp. BH-SS-21]|uniref:NACHT domain-containing protein n=1 Tax=Streptomyces liliiviolaceus TaxID=2823109 RepID=A0A941BAF9_9ACTN|nr:NACHT domain-containing protein [Streptomyces liliiviolaceus]MBQ0852717.1 NACHT domain-containing protein [Streptomyces liliiviolaceus]